jgi:hypothetical protein
LDGRGVLRRWASERRAGGRRGAHAGERRAAGATSGGWDQGIVSVSDVGDLSQFMEGLKQRFTQWFNAARAQGDSVGGPVQERGGGGRLDGQWGRRTST